LTADRVSETLEVMVAAAPTGEVIELEFARADAWRRKLTRAVATHACPECDLLLEQRMTLWGLRLTCPGTTCEYVTVTTLT
jgi:hypothetical protein